MRRVAHPPLLESSCVAPPAGFLAGLFGLLAALAAPGCHHEEGSALH